MSFQIKSDEGTNSASVSFPESNRERVVYAIAHVRKTNDAAWFDAVLTMDGKQVRRVRTTSDHEREDKAYDVVYVGTVEKGKSPTFRAETHRDAEFDPKMSGHVKLTAIAVDE